MALRVCAETHRQLGEPDIAQLYDDAADKERLKQGSQVVRQESAKLPIAGSTPAPASLDWLREYVHTDQNLSKEG